MPSKMPTRKHRRLGRRRCKPPKAKLLLPLLLTTLLLPLLMTLVLTLLLPMRLLAASPRAWCSLLRWLCDQGAARAGAWWTGGLACCCCWAAVH